MTGRFAIPKGTVIAVALVALLAIGGVAEAKGRADLAVDRGSVKVKKGKLRGSFVLLNKGKSKSKRSVAQLRVAVGDAPFDAGLYRTRPLRAGATQDVDVDVAIPAGLPDGSWSIEVCADHDGEVRERSERNNCSDVGSVGVGGASSVPSDPIGFKKDEAFEIKSGATPYWIFVPNRYDESHSTPTKLFLWMHGCGGESGGDIFTVSPGGSQDWISVSLGGRDGACWDPGADMAKVLGAIADVKSHFNISPRQVILGGYSSGGDLAYRTAFYNSNEIAGVLAEDTTPFRDTGSTQQASIAAATHRFDAVHLAHLQDDTYPIAGVRQETDAMIAAGFPLQRIEVRGTHYDNPGDVVNGQAVPGTDADVATHLLPHIGDGWTSPG